MKKFKRSDRVRLRKELDTWLPQGLSGTIVNVTGNDLTIQFDGVSNLIILEQEQAQEYLSLSL